MIKRFGSSQVFGGGLRVTTSLDLDLQRAAEEAVNAHLPSPEDPEGALVAIDVRSREVLALVGSYEGTRSGLDRATSAHRQPGSTFKAFVYSYGLHARQVTPATIVETIPS